MKTYVNPNRIATLTLLLLGTTWSNAYFNYSAGYNASSEFTHYSNINGTYAYTAATYTGPAFLVNKVSAGVYIGSYQYDTVSVQPVVAGYVAQTDWWDGALYWWGVSQISFPNDPNYQGNGYVSGM